MKLLTVLLLAAVITAPADEKKKKGENCCAGATEEFAAFGKDMAFVAAHEAPLPAAMKLDGGTMKEIPAADGQKARIFEVKAPAPTQKFLFVIHEWWGLNDYIKAESERLQKELGDVTVIALDLYDGRVTADPQTAAQYVQQVKEKRAQTIIKAAMEFAGPGARVATLGWCFGGGWSLQSALLLGPQAAGCVVYYGMPEKDVKRLRTLQCDVLGVFASQDGHITPKVVEQFVKNMKAAKKALAVHSYDAVHAFANPSNPKYDREKAEDAHAKVIAYLKAKFQAAP